MLETDLEILKSFIVFNQSVNIVVAAEQLKISQPLLSKRLSLFEKMQGQSVFQFTGRKKTLTHYGRALHEVILKHLRDLDDGLSRLQILNSDPKSAIIRIGGREELLERFAAQMSFPGRLDFIPMTGAETLQALRAHQLEIGVTQHHIDSLEFVKKPFCRDRFQIVIPTRLSLAHAALPQTLRELSLHPYLNYGEVRDLQKLMSYFSLKEFPRTLRSIPSWAVILEMCELLNAWSIAPDSLPLPRGLKGIAIPVKALPGTQFDLIYSREFSRLDWFQNLIKQIQSTAL